MQYVALWRMQLASRLLLDGAAVAEAAAAVGYESEAAFSRAFKKLVGHAPGNWRKDVATVSGDRFATTDAAPAIAAS
jgi:AraC-like DNA-binding protein